MNTNSNNQAENLAKPVLADGIIEKAIELLPATTYEPNEVGYFVKRNDVDMGDEDFCYKCIGKAVYKERKYHREGRLKIIQKFVIFFFGQAKITKKVSFCR